MSLSRLIVPLGLAIVFSGGPASAQTFSGEWNTNMGRMSLQQSGSSLTGSFSSQGRVTGTVTGNSVRGTYVNGSYRGEFEFTLSADGNAFTGRWWRPGRNESWTGTRIGSAPPAATPQPTPQPNPQPKPAPSGDFSGSWGTNMGQMELVQAGSQLRGEYGGSGKLTGTVTGNYARGTYVNGPSKGDFEFTLSPDGTAFAGRWWRPGRNESWTGTRFGGAPTATPRPGHQPEQPGTSLGSLEGLWRVEDASDGHNFNYHPVPWQIFADGQVRAGSLWSGTWSRAADGSISMQIITGGQVVDQFSILLSPDGRSFTARRNGRDYRYGDRM